jgi:hypothetical protein
MSADTQTQTGESSGGAAAEPRPWEPPDDASGWKARGRVRTPGGQLPCITAVVDLDAEQSDWVRQEARRTALSPVQFLKQLVDEARAATQGEVSRPGAST